MLLFEKFVSALGNTGYLNGALAKNSAVTGGVQCPVGIPLSCRNSTAIDDSCCFEYPGGILLLTQFWDYTPSAPNLSDDQLVDQLGPLDKFTIHGLWPDNCDGGFQQFCDRSLQIDDAYYLLQSSQFNGDQNLEISGNDLLAAMSKYWKSNTGDDESLWIHEYNKHGTCINTIKSQCYNRWDPAEVGSIDFKKQAVYDFYRITYNLYSKLDTYSFLNEKGIVPSSSTTYAKKDIEDALSSAYGQQVYIGCDRNGALNEIWYFHLLQGSLLSEEFVPIDTLKDSTSCPDNGILFPPKGYTGNPGGGNGGGDGEAVKGTVNVTGPNGGFIIKNGHWYISGTPATFTLTQSSYGSYFLKSKVGYCTVDEDNSLYCGTSYANAGNFDYDSDSGLIGYSGSNNWYAEDYPEGFSQSTVYAGSGNGQYQFNLQFSETQ